MLLDEVPQRVQDRFWSRVNIGNEDECWLFQMSTGNHGYGQMGWGGKDDRGMVLAHRLAYLLTHGEIPNDLTVDHICHVRRCCNPAHLRLLTNVENATDNMQGRKTHCPQGHPYDEANTYIDPRRARRCRDCAKAQKKKVG